MSDLYGQPVSEGTIVDSWLDTVTEAAPVNAQVKQQLTTHETVTHHDETRCQSERETCLVALDKHGKPDV
jgi:hypothetical protein